MAHLFDDVSCSGTVGKDHQAEYEGLLRSGWSVFTCLRCFQTHIDSQNWLRNHILQPQLSIQKSYVVCIYVQYTDILFTYKVPEANTHVPHHTQRGTDSTDGGKPPLVVSFSLCVWCGTCVLGSGTLYLNNMSVYCTYIHTTYDFCMDSCGWRIWFLSQFWLKIWVLARHLAQKNGLGF